MSTEKRINCCYLEATFPFGHHFVRWEPMIISFRTIINGTCKDGREKTMNKMWIVRCGCINIPTGNNNIQEGKRQITVTTR